MKTIRILEQPTYEIASKERLDEDTIKEAVNLLKKHIGLVIYYNENNGKIEVHLIRSDVNQ